VRVRKKEKEEKRKKEERKKERRERESDQPLQQREVRPNMHFEECNPRVMDPSHSSFGSVVVVGLRVIALTKIEPKFKLESYGTVLARETFM
jgi:hypothetical protein